MNGAGSSQGAHPLAEGDSPGREPVEEAAADAFGRCCSGGVAIEPAARLEGEAYVVDGDAAALVKGYLPPGEDSAGVRRSLRPAPPIPPSVGRAPPARRRGVGEAAAGGRPGAAVLDLGTGSGILAIAAARLGAKRVLALDIGPQAVEAARARAPASGVAGG